MVNTAVLALVRLMRIKTVMGLRMTIRRSSWSGGVVVEFGGWEKQVYAVCRSFAVLSVRL